MPATRILWGQVLAIFAIVLATNQAIARRLAYQPQLGEPWTVTFSIPLCHIPARPW